MKYICWVGLGYGAYFYQEGTSSQSMFIDRLFPQLRPSPITTDITYRKTSSLSRTKSQNFNVSHLVLQLTLPNPLKPNVKLRMKM